jgi:protein-L-isoaspartate(D-aspartate) O-methyltransferase
VAARLLQAAAIRRGDTILIIGAGSGYEAALGACLARFVVAVEEDAGIARQARAALVEHGIAAATVVEGALAQGHRPRAPYDVILATGAIAAVPPEIAGQLADGGRMPVVVRANGEVGHATLYTRSDGVLSHRIMFDAATPLLPGLAAKSAFVF